MDSQTIQAITSAFLAIIGFGTLILSYRNSGREENKSERGDLERSYTRVVAERDAALKERDQACEELQANKDLWKNWLRQEIADAIEDAARDAKK